MMQFVPYRNLLKKWMKEYNLCPKLCFLQTDTEPCVGIEEHYCLGACEKRETATDYNLRVSKAIESLSAAETFAVFDEGLQEDEISCIVVDKGCFFGMGYISKDLSTLDVNGIKESIEPMKDNAAIRQMIKKFTERNMGKVVYYK